mgnify:CR=1 FL=1
MRYTTASAQELQALLSHQIVLLDGAGGTMIQRHKLAEADFRGSQFRIPKPQNENAQPCADSDGPAPTVCPIRAELN